MRHFLFLIVLAFVFPSFAGVPKVIHTCLFGPSEKTNDMKANFDSWTQKAPGFKIEKWDESNFQIKDVPAIQKAFEAKQFDVVNGYCAARVLNDEGGLYLNPRVKLKQDIVFILEAPASFVFWHDGLLSSSVMVAEKNNPVIAAVQHAYENQTGYPVPPDFVLTKTIFKTVPGLLKNGTFQESVGVTLYPVTRFLLDLGDSKNVSSYTFDIHNPFAIYGINHNSLMNLFLNTHAIKAINDGQLMRLYPTADGFYHIYELNERPRWTYVDENVMILQWKKGYNLFLNQDGVYQIQKGVYRLPKAEDFGDNLKLLEGKPKKETKK